MPETISTAQSGGGHRAEPDNGPARQAAPEAETGDRWVDTGMWAVGLAAAVASWAGWVGLAILSGWNQHWTVGGLLPVYLAWLLPLAVDIYALIGFRVWLRSAAASETTRDYARKSTFTAIGLGVAANAGYHLMVSLGWTRAPWPVVVMVSALPPIMLGAVAHLSALRNRDHVAARPLGLVYAVPVPVETDAEAAVETAATDAPKVQETPTETGAEESSPESETNTPVPAQKRSETAKTTTSKTTPVKAQTTAKTTDEDHLKTIRETHPDWSSKTVSLGQIKTAIGISGQATAIRLRDALYPAGRPDQTAAADDLALPVPEPREPVSVGINGNHPTLTKEH